MKQEKGLMVCYHYRSVNYTYKKGKEIIQTTKLLPILPLLLIILPASFTHELSYSLTHLVVHIKRYLPPEKASDPTFK